MMMLHSEEATTCPIVEAPGNYHFEGYCEDCDVKRMASLTFDQVEGQYYAGRITQDEFDAYAYLHGRLSPYRGNPVPPTLPTVRRIARKLLHARSTDVVPELLERSVTTGPAETRAVS